MTHDVPSFEKEVVPGVRGTEVIPERLPRLVRHEFCPVAKQLLLHFHTERIALGCEKTLSTTTFVSLPKIAPARVAMR
jgi:hypothetical protein